MTVALTKRRVNQIMSSTLADGGHEVVGERTDSNTGEIVPVTRFDVVCEKVWQVAMTGEKWAVEMIFDRLEGKPRPAPEVNEQRDAAQNLALTSLKQIADSLDSKKEST